MTPSCIQYPYLFKINKLFIRNTSHFAELPEIIQRPASKTLRTNEPLILNCKAKGTPTPRIIWKKDGKVIQDGRGTSYVVERVKRQHAGHYTCVAKNDVGQVNASDIVVDVQCEYTYRPLVHHGNPANLEDKTKEIFSSGNWNLFSCKTILLFCKLTAFPRTRQRGLYAWGKQSRIITITECTVSWIRHFLAICDYFVGMAFTLIFFLPLRSDDYSLCSCASVTDPPLVVFPVTTLVVKSWLGHPTDLNCSAIANPSPRFEWFSNGEPVIDGIKQFRRGTTLTVVPRKTSDFTNYTCEVNNSLGRASAVFVLQPLSKFAI